MGLQEFQHVAFIFGMGDISVVEMYPMLEVVVLIDDGFDTGEDVELAAVAPICSDNGGSR